MPDRNIARHSLRLCLRDDKHRKIERVLAGLDMDIHKSINEFIINALDFYISSFDDDVMTGAEHQEKKPEFLTRDDLAGIEQEIRDDVKNEIIRLLGSALTGAPAVRMPEGSARPVQGEKAEEQGENPVVADLANMWG